MRKMILAAVLMFALPLSLAAQQPGTKPRRVDPQQRCEKMFKSLDDDGDGKISKDEYLAKHAWFDNLDRNKDGRVTQDEVKSASEGRKPEAEERLEKRFERLDGNHDGVVTKEELVAARQKTFERLDTNKDGAITREECLNRPVRQAPVEE
jgi:Ca2+-binding EF-hand superfamily protein